MFIGKALDNIQVLDRLHKTSTVDRSSERRDRPVGAQAWLSNAAA
ncbi:hypothetical protein [Bradyrhizobium sp. USDA 336]